MSHTPIEVIREALSSAHEIMLRDNPDEATDPSVYNAQLTRALAALKQLEGQEPVNPIPHMNIEDEARVWYHTQDYNIREQDPPLSLLAAFARHIMNLNTIKP